MSTSDPLVDHLQQNSSRIARMLSPGNKSNRAGTPANFSPVAPDFAGRKFQLAAQKMRVLNAERMGRVLPADKAKGVGAEIKARFEHANQLLHLPTKPASASGGWSKVDMTVPRGGGSEKPQVSNDPGSMSAGSVIPRMSTFPKPGQSLDSFKDQVQRNQPTRKPAPVVPKTPRLAPKDRLFSRVQEMTPGSADSDKETSSEADATPTPAPSTPPAASQAARSTVQRQPDNQHPSLPTNQVQRQPVAEPEPLKAAREQKAGAEPLKTALPSAKLSNRSASEPRLARARPALRTEKPETQPVRPPAALPSKPAQSAGPALNRPQIPQAQALKSGQAAPQRPNLPEIQPGQASASQVALEPAAASKKAAVSERKPESTSRPESKREPVVSPRLPEPKQAAAEPARPSRKVEAGDSALQSPQREPESKPALPVRVKPESGPVSQPASLDKPESKPALPLALPVRVKPESGPGPQPASLDKPARRSALPIAQPARRMTRSRIDAPGLPKARVSRPSTPAYEPASQTHKLPLAKPGTAQGSPQKSAGAPTASPAQAAGSSQNVVQRQLDASAAAASTLPARENRANAPTLTPQNRSSQAAPSPEPASPPAPKKPIASSPTQPMLEKPGAPLPSASPASKQPLQQVFEYRRLAASRIKASPLAEQLTSSKASPLIEPAPKPLVSARKYQSPSAPSEREARERMAPLAGLTASAQTRPSPNQPSPAASGTGQSVMRQPDNGAGSAVSQRVSPPRMDLAKVFSGPANSKNGQPAQPAAVSGSQQPPRPGSPTFGPPAIKFTTPATPLTASPTAPAPAAPAQKIQASRAHNVVQRTQDDSTQSGQVDTNVQPPPQKRSNPADIEPLAVKLLPYIKHLMEIEAERNGRLFR